MAFHFDKDNVVKCNFNFPDVRRQQQRDKEGGAHDGRLNADDGEFSRVSRSGNPFALVEDWHGVLLLVGLVVH